MFLSCFIHKMPLITLIRLLASWALSSSLHIQIPTEKKKKKRQGAASKSQSFWWILAIVWQRYEGQLSQGMLKKCTKWWEMDKIKPGSSQWRRTSLTYKRTTQVGLPENCGKEETCKIVERGEVCWDLWEEVWWELWEGVWWELWAGLWWELWAGVRLTVTCGKKQGLLGTVERQFLNAFIWTKNVPFWKQTEASPTYWNSIINRANSWGHAGSRLWEGHQFELSCDSGNLCGCHRQDSEIVTATWESKSSWEPQPSCQPT